jgi:hypothetical protein
MYWYNTSKAIIQSKTITACSFPEAPGNDFFKLNLSNITR